jgi:hypothetical protein
MSGTIASAPPPYDPSHLALSPSLHIHSHMRLQCWLPWLQHSSSKCPCHQHLLVFQIFDHLRPILLEILLNTLLKVFKPPHPFLIPYNSPFLLSELSCMFTVFSHTTQFTYYFIIFWILSKCIWTLQGVLLTDMSVPCPGTSRFSLFIQ